MNRIALAALTSAAALAACAPMDEDALLAADETAKLSLAQEGEECFFPRSVTGFRNAPDSADGDEQIYVDAAGDTYLFETFSSCPRLDFARGIAFDQNGIGTICRGIDVDLVVPDRTLGPQRCPVSMVRKVIEDEDR